MSGEVATLKRNTYNSGNLFIVCICLTTAYITDDPIVLKIVLTNRCQIMGLMNKIRRLPSPQRPPCGSMLSVYVIAPIILSNLCIERRTFSHSIVNY